MIITLVGFQYHNTNDYISSLSTGYSFKLKRDESNDFDDKAIGVYDNDRLVAYVKREDAHNLWNSVIDELSCTIIEDLGNAKRVQVHIVTNNTSTISSQIIQHPKKIERDFKILETNFFGINLYECPNEEWIQILEGVEEGKTEYLYQKDDIKCTLKVTKATSEKVFIFNMPYNYENYINLGYCIEKNIIKKNKLSYIDYLNNHEFDLEDLHGDEGIAVISFNNKEHMIAFVAKPPSITITFWLDWHKKATLENEKHNWKETDFRIKLIEKDLSEGKIICFSQSTSIIQVVPTQLENTYLNRQRYGLTEEVWNKVLNYLETAKYAVLDPYNPEVFSETKSIAYNLTKDDEELEYLNHELFELDDDDWHNSQVQKEISERSRYLYSKTTIRYNLIGGEYLGFDILNVVVLNRFAFNDIDEVQAFLIKKKEELYNAELFESFLKDNKIAYSKFQSEGERLSDDLIGMF